MDNIIRITKEFKFEASHALSGHEGLCKNVHGHSYKLSVTVIGKPIQDRNNPKYGMVMDFSDLKKIINNIIVEPFDHATVLNMYSNKELVSFMEYQGHKIVKVDYQPTSEMMILDFAERIKSNLPNEVKLRHLILRETGTCFAEWNSSDYEP
tara:strand:+ start:80 stop:535 length:456 start_codon:yes stop_codon:yes gene_type:complete